MDAVRTDLRRYSIRGLALLAGLTLVAGTLLAMAGVRVYSVGREELLILSVLAVVLALTSARHPIRFPGTHCSVSISEAITFLAVMMLGPFYAALLAAIDQTLASHRLKLRPSLYLFNISNHTISMFLAGQVYYVVAQESSSQLGPGIGQSLVVFALPLLALAFTHYTLHLTVVGVMSHMTHGARFWETVRDTFPWEPVTYMAGATVAGLINYAFTRHGAFITGVTLLLVLPVPIIIYYTFKTYHDKLGEKQTHYEKVTSIYDSIIEMLAMAIDAKDDVTHDHLQRVKLFARRMGEMMGLTDLEIEALEAGALLHDIGKIGVPAYILNKPGKLTEHEFEQMKMHTILGADMLSNIDFRYPVVPIVRHHHERWDGLGYPDGLKGDAIPVTARILTLVDNYDALRSERPYKSGMNREEALAYITQNSGTSFDPKLVAVFLKVVDELEAEAEALRPSEADRAMRTRSTTMTKAGPAAGYYTPPPVDRAAAALSSIAETNHRVMALYEMSRTLPSMLSLEDTVAILSSRLAGLIPYTTCAISIFDASHSEFETVHAVGPNAERFLKRRQPVSAGITGWVITNQRAMYNTNPVLDLGFLGTSVATEYKGVMVFPLVKDIVIGAISLYSMEIETYDSSLIQLMESIAGPASDAVYNALAYQQVQRAAIPVRATATGRLRALTTEIDRERARSQRCGTPLSLIVIRVNNINAAASRANATSDQIMVWLGDLLKRQVRETDIVGRHTDNAFVALLPDSGQREAAEVGIRMREAIYKAGSLKEIEVNLGAATSPGDGDSFEELLHVALEDCAADANSIGLISRSMGDTLITGTL
jgi:diguanylate cyclase (GGDEF)-like protein/putative nucleotidyltransferase with HDIG domain